MGEHFQQRPCERRTKRKTQFSQSKIFPGSQKLPRNSVAAKSWWGIRSPRPRMRAFSACWFAALTANRLQISNLQQIARTVAFIREQVLPRQERFSTQNHADGIFRMENPGIGAWRSSERNMQRRSRVNRSALSLQKRRVTPCAPAIAGAEN